MADGLIDFRKLVEQFRLEIFLIVFRRAVKFLDSFYLDELQL